MKPPAPFQPQSQPAGRFFPVLLLACITALTLATNPACAAEATARPTLKELKPLVEKAALAAFQQVDRNLDLQSEIVEIGAPGWAPLTGPDKEDVFWPVKVKCSGLGQPSGPLGGPQEVVVVFRVYRVGAEWKTDSGEFASSVSMATMLRSRQVAMRNACINNLRQIDGAKEQWALENRKTMEATPTFGDLVGTDKYIRVKPACPAGGTYAINAMNKEPECSVNDHSLNAPLVAANPAQAKNVCINNLRQLDGAKEQWALENRKTAADIPTPMDLYGRTKYIKVEPRCPSGGTYQLNDMRTKPKCSVAGHELP